MKNKKQLEKENRQYGRLLIAFLIFNIFLIVTVVYMAYQTPIELIEIDKEEKQIHIEYVNMTAEQMRIFESVMDDVNDLYFTKNRNIMVVNGLIDEDNPFRSGYNDGDGKLIIVKYSSNLNTLRGTLCHEMLHSYIYGEKDLPDPIHEIVYDLERQEVCFRNKLK